MFSTELPPVPVGSAAVIVATSEEMHVDDTSGIVCVMMIVSRLIVDPVLGQASEVVLFV